MWGGCEDSGPLVQPRKRCSSWSNFGEDIGVAGECFAYRRGRGGGGGGEGGRGSFPGEAAHYALLRYLSVKVRSIDWDLVARVCAQFI